MRWGGTSPEVDGQTHLGTIRREKVVNSAGDHTSC